MIVWRIIFLTCVALLGFAGNTLAIIVLVKHPGMMAETTRLLINQSILDALASVLLLTSRGYIEVALGFTKYYTDNWFDHFLCKTWSHGSFIWGVVLASTYNLVFVTLERCLKITLPFWYREHITPKLIGFTIAFVWLFGNLFEQLYLLQAFELNISHKTCELDQTFFAGVQYIVFGGMPLVIESILSMVCLLVFYSLILRKVQKQRKSMQQKNTGGATQQGSGTFINKIFRRNQVHDILEVSPDISTSTPSSASVSMTKRYTSTTLITDDPSKLAIKAPELSMQNDTNLIPSSGSSGQSTENNGGQSKKKNTVDTKYKASEMKIIKTLTVVCGGFFICYLPTLILLLLTPLLGMSQRDIPYWFSLSSTFSFLNCAINPIIYICMHDKIRTEALHTIQYFCNRQKP